MLLPRFAAVVGRLAQPAFQVGGGHGSAQVVALGGVAAERRKLLPGLLGLHAFGDNPQALQVGLGLVLKDELVVLQRPPQVCKSAGPMRG